MADPRKVKVMISSRAGSTVVFDDCKLRLTQLRREIKSSLEEIELFGSPLFEVTINEDAPASSGRLSR